MKIVTILGARPQFIKAAAVSKELRTKHKEIIVHTGQHYDKNMSEIFFDELGIPRPDFNLSVGSGTHAYQTAKMMIKIEDILIDEKPDAVLTYGDTNSTLAAAITAAKLCIPIAHVEAGVRAFIKDMPEEQNRIVADHLATWNFAPSDQAVKYLYAEGIKDGVYNVGDVMYDALIYYQQRVDEFDKDYFFKRLKYIYPSDIRLVSSWYLTTIHRPENTNDINTFSSILDGLESLDYPVIFPVHPRTKHLVKSLHNLKEYKNIHFVEPLSYIDMIFFAKNAVKIITDSGGLHKEAFLMKVPAVVILRGSAWEETLNGNCNVLCSPNKDDIVKKTLKTKIDYNFYNKKYYGDGTAARQITNIIK